MHILQALVPQLGQGIFFFPFTPQLLPEVKSSEVRIDPKKPQTILSMYGK